MGPPARQLDGPGTLLNAEAAGFAEERLFVAFSAYFAASAFIKYFARKPYFYLTSVFIGL